MQMIRGKETGLAIYWRALCLTTVLLHLICCIDAVKCPGEAVPLVTSDNAYRCILQVECAESVHINDQRVCIVTVEDLANDILNTDDKYLAGQCRLYKLHPKDCMVLFNRLEARRQQIVEQMDRRKFCRIQLDDECLITNEEYSDGLIMLNSTMLSYRCKILVNKVVSSNDDKFIQNNYENCESHMLHIQNNFLNLVRKECSFKYELGGIERCLIDESRMKNLSSNFEKNILFVNSMCTLYQGGAELCHKISALFQRHMLSRFLNDQCSCFDEAKLIENKQINIYILAFTRPRSLHRLLTSLNNAIYIDKMNLTINIVIIVDGVQDEKLEQIKSRQESLDVANNFIWKRGKKSVIENTMWLGLRNQWLSAVTFHTARDMQSLNIILEDDLKVSKFYFMYLLVSVCNYFKHYQRQNETKVGMISFHPQLLTSLSTVPHNKSLSFGGKTWQFLMKSPISSSPFYLSPDVASHGVILVNDVWRKFLRWYEKYEDLDLPSLIKNSLNKKQQLLVTSSLLYAWYKNDLKSKNNQENLSMWTLHFNIFCMSNQYLTVYPNLNDLNKTYASHLREKGEHFDGTLGQDMALVDDFEHIWEIITTLNESNPKPRIDNTAIGSYKIHKQVFSFRWQNQIELKQRDTISSFSIFAHNVGKGSRNSNTADENTMLKWPLNAKVELELVSHVSNNYKRQLATNNTEHGEIHYLCPDVFEVTLSCHKQKLKFYSGNGVIFTEREMGNGSPLSCFYDDKSRAWHYPVYIQTPLNRDICDVKVLHVFKNYEWLIPEGLKQRTVFDSISDWSKYPFESISWWSNDIATGFQSLNGKWEYEMPYKIEQQTNITVEIGESAFEKYLAADTVNGTRKSNAHFQFCRSNNYHIGFWKKRGSSTYIYEPKLCKPLHIGPLKISKIRSLFEEVLHSIINEKNKNDSSEFKRAPNSLLQHQHAVVYIIGDSNMHRLFLRLVNEARRPGPAYSHNTWDRLLLHENKQRNIYERFNPETTGISNLNLTTIDSNAIVGTLMYIPMQTLLGDPRPPYAPWNKGSKLQDDAYFGRIRRLPERLKELHATGQAGGTPDVIIFSVGQWDAHFMTFDDYLGHLHVELERFAYSFKESKVTIVIILQVGFSGRSPCPGGLGTAHNVGRSQIFAYALKQQIQRLKRIFTNHTYHVFDAHAITRGLYHYQKEFFEDFYAEEGREWVNFEICCNHMPPPVYNEIWRGILTILSTHEMKRKVAKDTLSPVTQCNKIDRESDFILTKSAGEIDVDIDDLAIKKERKEKLLDLYASGLMYGNSIRMDIHVDSPDNNILFNYKNDIPTISALLFIFILLAATFGSSRWALLHVIELSIYLVAIKFFDAKIPAINIETSYDGFYSAVCIIILLVIMTSKKIAPPPRLERDNDKSQNQDLRGVSGILNSRLYILEWKGLMQVIFLLYHYFGCNNDVKVFSMIRCFVASYLFLSGYGYTVQLLLEGPQQTIRTYMVRCCKICRKLFVLPILLSYVTRTPITVYYVVVLHALHAFTLCTVLFLCGICFHFHGDRAKRVLMLCCYTCSMLYLHNQPQRMPFFTTSLLKLIPNTSTSNMLFRLRLDQMSSVYGVATAILMKEYMGLSSKKTKLWVHRSFHIIASILACIWVINILQMRSQQEYLRQHMYLSFCIIPVYWALRSASPISSYVSYHLVWVGERSFEFYLLQFHIFLVQRATKVPQFLGETYTFLNFIFGACLFVVFVWRVNIAVTAVVANFNYFDNRI